MASHEALKLSYITSMATGGLAGFNYREINGMLALGTDIKLFITKYMQGPYMPPDLINVFKVRFLKSFIFVFMNFINNPIKFFVLIIQSIKTGTIADFVIAQYWIRVMKKTKRNWIHCHWGDHKLYIGYYCHKALNIPLSVTLHGYDIYANPNWKMYEIALEACAKIITISEYNRKYLSQKYEHLKDKIEVIRLSADLPKKDFYNSSIKYILIVGGFHYRKGYDILIEALSRLNRDDLHLWIVGYKGPVDVRGFIEKFNLQERVTILGQVSDEILKILYCNCDIFCMPSRMDHTGIGEGLPVSLMEAMSYEKSIVSTYHTGIPELVPDILVEENDIDGLAKGIAKLADDKDLRIKTGQRNRKIIEKDYSNNNIRQLVNSFKIDN